MTLKLYMHPLASYCQKVLMALYEAGTPFERQIVDLGNEPERAAFLKISPFGKFPLLCDETNSRMVPESTMIIEYLARHYPGQAALIPVDPERAFETRQCDRFFDIYVHEPMQKIVGDKIRPAGKTDAFGVEQARAVLKTAYGVLDGLLAGRIWAVGETVTMADCAAAAPLFFANLVQPFKAHSNLVAYCQRLKERPSFARVQAEAEPYMKMFPA